MRRSKQVQWQFERRVFCCGLGVWLAGCAGQAPLVKPEFPVPNHWPQSASGGGSQLNGVEWNRFFADSRLRAMIALALQNNRDLRIAAARVQEARAMYSSSQAELGPMVSVSAAGSFERTPSTLSDSAIAATSRRLDIGLPSVTFELDFWGRLANLSESARRTYLATEQSRRAVYLSLVADVALGYLTYLQFRELAASEQTAVGLRQQAVSLVEGGQKAGGASDAEYQQAISELESSQSALSSYEHQVQLSINRMNYLLGHAEFDFSDAVGLESQGLDVPLSPGLPADVLLLRPDVMAAEQRLLAAHVNIAAARAAFFPRVSLTAGLGLAGQGLLSLFSGGTWIFQPVITLPLFDGGRAAAGLDLARARKVIAVAEYERAIQIAFREVADLLSARTSLAKQVQSVSVALKAQTRRLEIALGRHEAGAGSFLDVLEARRTLISMQQSSVQLRRAQLDANVQLYKAMGGGGDSFS